MGEGRLIARHDEAIVLRTWAFHEADLLVSLFTRERGKVKGVARHAMKSRRRFGGALEPGTQVMAHYTERPREDLVRCDSFEIVWSPLRQPMDLTGVAGLQVVLEVLDEVLPELAPDDNVFRLAVAVLTAMQGGAVWVPVTYFCLWMCRLMGWMPELGRCVVCGQELRDDMWWSPTADGVSCADDRRPGSVRLGAGTVAEVRRVFRSSVVELAAETWDASRAEPPLQLGLALLERNLERRIRSAAALMR